MGRKVTITIGEDVEVEVLEAGLDEFEAVVDDEFDVDEPDDEADEEDEEPNGDAEVAE